LNSFRSNILNRHSLAQISKCKPSESPTEHSDTICQISLNAAVNGGSIVSQAVIRSSPFGESLDTIGHTDAAKASTLKLPVKVQVTISDISAFSASNTASTAQPVMNSKPTSAECQSASGQMSAVPASHCNSTNSLSLMDSEPRARCQDPIGQVSDSTRISTSQTIRKSRPPAKSGLQPVICQNSVHTADANDDTNDSHDRQLAECKATIGQNSANAAVASNGSTVASQDIGSNHVAECHAEISQNTPIANATNGLQPSKKPLASQLMLDKIVR